MINARELIGTHDVLFITLDTLRYDVAMSALEQGLTPNLAAVLPDGTWERRHTPGSFTFAAHQAFFAGFLPTPAEPGRQKDPRLFAAAFPGSETTAPETCVFEQPDIVSGLADRGYHSICIGGVGFFNKLTPLGTVLPGLFAESHWSAELGVTHPRSTENQIRVALDCLDPLPREQRAFLFLNVSAIHQPNNLWGTSEESVDSVETMKTALSYVDGQLAPLFDAMRRRAPVLCVICSDHGTAYGEDGYQGHRLSHTVVWDVPYAEFVLVRQTNGT